MGMRRCKEIPGWWTRTNTDKSNNWNKSVAQRPRGDVREVNSQQGNCVPMAATSCSCNRSSSKSRTACPKSSSLLKQLRGAVATRTACAMSESFKCCRQFILTALECCSNLPILLYLLDVVVGDWYERTSTLSPDLYLLRMAFRIRCDCIPGGKLFRG